VPHLSGRAWVVALQLAALAVIAGRIWTRLVPAVEADMAFAAFSTAARLFLDHPHVLPNVYDNAWFIDQVHRHGFPHVNDVYNINPPMMGVLVTPLALMPAGLARFFWPAVNVAALAVGADLLRRTLALPARATLPLLAVLTLAEPVGFHFEKNQIYLILFAWLCLFVLAWTRGSTVRAGVALSLMLTFKTAGAWIFLQRLIRRDWVLVRAAVVTSVTLIMLSLALTGTDVWLAYLARLPELATSPVRYVPAYQTTAGVFGHLLVHDPQWSRAPIVNAPVLAAVLAAAAFLVSLALTVHAEPSPSTHRETRALHAALISSLVVTNSPFAEEHHYVLVLPSLVIAWWWLARLPRPRLWSWWITLAVATVALVVPLPYEAPMFADGAWAVLAYPRVWGAYALWAWLLVALRRF
jgi:hypothetical protein